MSGYNWPSSTSAAKPCGQCWRCGGTLYEYLTHHCTTSVRIVNPYTQPPAVPLAETNT